MCEIYPWACKSYKLLLTSFILLSSPQVSDYKSFVIATSRFATTIDSMIKVYPFRAQCISKSKCTRIWLLYYITRLKGDDCKLLPLVAFKEGQYPLASPFCFTPEIINSLYTIVQYCTFPLNDRYHAYLHSLST